MRLRDNLKEDMVRGEAIKMLATEGFDGFSMNKLAKVSNVSVATLYIYYKDKDTLLKQIGTDIGRSFMQNTLKDFSAKMPFAEGLKKTMGEQVCFRYSISAGSCLL
jgi:TetR/AcrR family transcriptional repressor of multidrug resistance operon